MAKKDVGVEERILQVLKVMLQQELIKGFGHVSCRLPGGDRFMITGHIHEADLTLDQFTPEHLITANLAGEKVAGQLDAPEEIHIHSCIYQARRDIGGVIHYHPLYSTTLSVAGRHVLPVTYSGKMFAPRVPLYDDPNLIDTRERGQAMARAMGAGLALVLRAHGAVAAGSSPEEAAGIALTLEDQARMQILASCAGQPQAILVSELDEKVTQGSGQLTGMRTVWNYYLARSR